VFYYEKADKSRYRFRDHFARCGLYIRIDIQGRNIGIRFNDKAFVRSAAYIFPIIWTALYILMGVGAGLDWCSNSP
jgi:hypothetical protein